MTWRLVALGAAVAALVMPASAVAATSVSMPDEWTILIRSTTPGEVNHVTTEVDGGALLVGETQAPSMEVTAPCIDLGYGGAACPVDGVDRIRMELGPGDDVVEMAEHAIRHELYGQDGDDLLEGGLGNDLLDGGPGVDQLIGFDGNDLLNAEDGQRDAVLDCGPGDDDVDTDLLLGTSGAENASGCDVFAPEVGPVDVRAFPVRQPFQVGGQLVAWSVPVSPGASPTFRWHRCTRTGACGPAGQPSISHVLSEADAGHSLVLEVTVSNRLGTKSSRSAPTPLIAPRPARQPQPQNGSLIRLTRRLTAETALTDAVKHANAALTRAQVRRLLRGRTVRVNVKLPEGGRFVVRWTISAKAARRHGVRARRAVLVARGTATVVANTQAGLAVKLTRTGRRLLRRTGALRTSAGATLVVGGLGTLQPKPVAVTLRR